ncbi:hypothetical protein CEUSTIGMA_g140.t1 [Chlamydomonas eustigma]|uniref:DNA polymerase delta subunit 4 n=1 Tax=Chlamydomonas eustigma TaxID=1157962 RepID=A0A250WPB1_9CHLO|nr:hypothetical protein CEUSTIGMA_g140.t1 [Chlamydomonas eustigma]|eukprot:GAX72684.1 hypothetical protein CEUSTIGMA_g140.t1 [Chlamydomonas eustigma]
MMSNRQEKVSSFFQNKKRKETEKSANTRSTRVKENEHENLSTPTNDTETATEKCLRSFDLTSKFGPCCGVTRLERWKRAHSLGLHPPNEVLEILNKLEPADPAHQSIWFNRI